MRALKNENIMRMPPPELKKGRIEIIPMIDTIFFLLVFFMVTWLSMVKMNGLTLNLPRQTQASSKPPVSVTVSVSPGGTYYLNSHPIGAAVWQQALGERLKAQPNSVVVLNMAANQKAQTLISLMDTVNHVIARTQSHAQVLIATPRVAAGPTESKNTHAQQ